jgi:hypothetical protein
MPLCIDLPFFEPRSNYIVDAATFCGCTPQYMGALAFRQRAVRTLSVSHGLIRKRQMLPIDPFDRPDGRRQIAVAFIDLDRGSGWSEAKGEAT